MSDKRALEWPTTKASYIPKQTLGEGTYGHVLTAFCEANSTRCALKSMHLEDLSIADVQREVALLRSLSNPHIVEIYTAFVDGESLCIITELCLYGALDGILKRAMKNRSELLAVVQKDNAQKGLLPQECVATIAQHVLMGLAYIHSKDVIHRDIKTDNLFLGGDGSVKIGDFGVSYDNLGSGQTGASIIGTPLWMAPEVIKGEQYDSTVDIWSFGITLIELVVGVPPYFNRPVTVVMQNITRGAPPGFAQVPDTFQISNLADYKDITSLLGKMLLTDPAARSSAESLLKESCIKRAKSGNKLLEALAKMNVLEDKSDTMIGTLPDEADDQSIEHSEWNFGGTEGNDTEVQAALKVNPFDNDDEDTAATAAKQLVTSTDSSTAQASEKTSGTQKTSRSSSTTSDSAANEQQSPPASPTSRKNATPFPNGSKDNANSSTSSGRKSEVSSALESVNPFHDEDDETKRNTAANASTTTATTAAATTTNTDPSQPHDVGEQSRENGNADVDAPSSLAASKGTPPAEMKLTSANLQHVREFLRKNANPDGKPLAIGQYKFHMRVKHSGKEQAVVNFSVNVTSENPASFAAKLLKSGVLQSKDDAMEVVRGVETLMRQPESIAFHFLLSKDRESLPQLSTIDVNSLPDDIALLVLVQQNITEDMELPSLIHRAEEALDKAIKKMRKKQKAGGDKAKEKEKDGTSSPSSTPATDTPPQSTPADSTTSSLPNTDTANDELTQI